MASTIELVLTSQDEAQLFVYLAQWNLTVYPERIPPDYEPFPADESAPARLVDESYYLAAEDVAPIEVREVKRGRNRGMLEIEELESPVIHYTRSIVDDSGALVAGRLWTALSPREAEVHPARPEAFRKLWMALREHVARQFRKSKPSGWFIGPDAARQWRTGLKLRQAGHKGKPLQPFR